eukprot:6214342-Pleurochrysis_carterae.AAC.3
MGGSLFVTALSVIPLESSLYHRLAFRQWSLCRLDRTSDKAEDNYTIRRCPLAISCFAKVGFVIESDQLLGDKRAHRQAQPPWAPSVRASSVSARKANGRRFEISASFVPGAVVNSVGFASGTEIQDAGSGSGDSGAGCKTMMVGWVALAAARPFKQVAASEISSKVGEDGESVASSSAASVATKVRLGLCVC